MSDMLSKRLRWGVVRIFWRGVREKGGSSEPPEPPLVTGLTINSSVRDDVKRLNDKCI